MLSNPKIPTDNQPQFAPVYAPTLDRYPCKMTCPSCGEEIVTRVETKRGLMNWLVCAGLCLPLCIFGYVLSIQILKTNFKN